MGIIHLKNNSKATAAAVVVESYRVSYSNISCKCLFRYHGAKAKMVGNLRQGLTVTSPRWIIGGFSVSLLLSYHQKIYAHDISLEHVMVFDWQALLRSLSPPTRNAARRHVVSTHCHLGKIFARSRVNCSVDARACLARPSCVPLAWQAFCSQEEIDPSRVS